jgi:hypothetical protein
MSTINIAVPEQTIIFPDLIWPCDIFATKGEGIVGWASYHLTKTPSGLHTDRFHFGVIGHPVFDKCGRFVDFETRESIDKGPSCARFFEIYLGSDIEIYRSPGITKEEAYRGVLSTSAIGRAKYGYKDFVILVWDAVDNMFHRKFPPYTSQQLKYSANDVYICTEEAAYAYRNMDRPIEPPSQERIWDIPTVYRQALEEGRLAKWYKGNLRDLYQQYIDVNMKIKIPA